MHKALITHDNYFDLFGHYESTVDLTMSLYHCLRKECHTSRFYMFCLYKSNGLGYVSMNVKHLR